MNIASKAVYFFRYVAFRPSRLLNLVLVKISKELRFPRVLGMPITLMLEPTDICNLKCPLCPTGLGLLGRKKAMMRFDDFKRIIDELGPYLIHLRLWNWGEPLINKEIYKMIEYAKKFDIFVNTSTNSFFLTEENASKLVKSGLDELIVSLDGASEETYKKYRKQGSFSKAISAMKKLVLEKRRLRSKTPIIKMQFIMMRHNEHEVEKAINLARSIGIDEIFFKTVGMMDTSVYEPIEQYLPLNPKFRRYNLKEGKAKAKQITNFCEYLWDETTINVDGSVVPCCRDSHNSYVFGNIFKEKFREIWNNEKYASFRKQVLKDKQKIGLCENCSGSKKEFKIKEINFS